MDFGVSEKKKLALLARMQACKIKESDLEEHFVRGSGPGGQKINKTSVCVNLKHKPTGIVIKMQRERNQRTNRYLARKRLCELIEEKTLGKKSPSAIKAEKIRKQKSRRKRRSSLKLDKKD